MEATEPWQSSTKTKHTQARTIDTLRNGLGYSMFLLYFTQGCTRYIVESILKVHKTSTLPLNWYCPQPQCNTQCMLVKTTLQHPEPSTPWGESQVYIEDSCKDVSKPLQLTLLETLVRLFYTLVGFRSSSEFSFHHYTTIS